MKKKTQTAAKPDVDSNTPSALDTPLPGEVVLVLQGGGALGAYQVGVYQALQEAGIEPDWVIGTSIGAINGAIIAGNPPEKRVAALLDFWQRVQHKNHFEGIPFLETLNAATFNMMTVLKGIPLFFKPNPLAWLDSNKALGAEKAAYYTTQPLQKTLSELVDFDYVNNGPVRLTVGAVNVRNSKMHYFDSREETLNSAHVMASGALPPAFPAVRIDGETYWDGGIYSNTPIEAVLDDKPRRNSVIFSVNVWHEEGPEPETLRQVMGRQKDIQYASRAKSHIERQQQIHRLRHIIRELGKQMPNDKLQDSNVRELLAWGCGTTMHVCNLIAPQIDGEDYTKDIDFTAAGIEARRFAGYENTKRFIASAPWKAAVDPIEGVVIHHC